MEFHNLSLKKQLQGLKEGSFSSTELTTHYLERIEKYDGELNSFISVTAERALIQAKILMKGMQIIRRLGLMEYP